MNTLLQADNIAFSYNHKLAVDHISFQIEEGQILGFLGPNGAGKSTTLKMLTGLIKPQTGTIRMFDQDIFENIDKTQTQIGVCFEEKNLYEDMSAAENLKFFAALFKIHDLDTKLLLERVGLPTNRKDQIKNFSKGMKQRLMVARALVNNPTILFLDEPTDGLDPVSSEAIRSVIREERDKGVSVFLTTHDMLEADKLSNQVAFINEGRIVALDSPYRLKHQFGTRVVQVKYEQEDKLITREISLEQNNTGLQIQEIEAQYPISEIHTKEASLEDIFIQLTGRELE